jgi:hypothetical protein
VFGYQCFDEGWDRGDGARVQDVVCCGANFFGCRREFRFCAAGNDYFFAIADEALGEGFADAATAAGDEGGFEGVV